MYQKIEVQLNTPSLEKDPDFERSLVKLYSNIVYFLACAANHLNHGTFVRTAANITVWNGWISIKQILTRVRNTANHPQTSYGGRSS
jgi:hypothetical protein